MRALDVKGAFVVLEKADKVFSFELELEIATLPVCVNADVDVGAVD
jgi:hypothetical protein